MKFFLEVPVHTYTKGYWDDKINHFHTIQSRIYSNKAINKTIKEKFLSLIVDSSTLSKPLSVYFDPNCKYPRFKLNDCTDLKRVIKYNKADAVIMNDTWKNTSLWDSTMYTSNKHYLIDGHIYIVYDSYLKNGNILEFLNLPEKTEYEILEYKYSNNASKNQAQSMYNIMNVYKKIILTEDIDKMINGNLLNMSEEEYESIKNLLNSTDTETNKLGLKMLGGYNTNDNAVKIGNLIMETCIQKAHLLNDVSTTNILNTLNISRSDLRSVDGYKTYLRKFIKVSTDEEDLEFAKKILTNMVKTHTQKYYTSLLSGYDKLDIKVDFDVTY